ncbi:MAG: hypothetical protein WD009_01395 [Phycisphaeraceae bacterium]
MTGSSTDRESTFTPATGFMGAIDAWMAANPWHPRIAPFIVYLALLAGINLTIDASPYLYPVLYAIQFAVVAAMLWRYRLLLPELTLRFHWLAIPTGLGLCAAWIGLGFWMIALAPAWFAADGEPHYFERMADTSTALYGISLGLRLAGMAILVPLFEELFIRSACLRGLHSARKTGLGLVQLVEDLPIVGDWVLHSRLGQRVRGLPGQFTEQLRECPVGMVTAFGFAASTFVFMVHHVQRDWPGTIACAVVWCWLLWYTNRGDRRMGLGPIVWSHGITNAALWAWSLGTGDWQFM